MPGASLSRTLSTHPATRKKPRMKLACGSPRTRSSSTPPAARARAGSQATVQASQNARRGLNASRQRAVSRGGGTGVGLCRQRRRAAASAAACTDCLERGKIRMSLLRRLTVAAAAAGALAAAGLTSAATAQARPTGPTFLSNFSTETPVSPAASPLNGDQNPYGVFIVQQSTGLLHAGNILVSDFNNAGTLQNPGGLQGTGRTILQITPGGGLSVFATIDPATLPGPCPGGVGLTTALEVLPGGWVVV